MPTFADKVEGSLYGGAIGDAMGAPVEGWPPESISERFQGVQEFLPAIHGGDPYTGKGHGRITDDTLMVEALIRAYLSHRDHLDAYDFEQFMIPEFSSAKVWVPERQQEMPLLERLWWPEKYPWVRMVVNRAEPRTAGVGNCVNCGVAMYMMPVGVVNAGDPRAAYEEAVGFASAHNESFAVEAGAVMAAAVSAALSVNSSVEKVLETALNLSRDGTALAIKAVVSSVCLDDDLPTFIGKTREAVEPFITPVRYQKGAPTANVVRASRQCSIEELPVALAALKYGGGTFLRTLHAAVFYGRDCDSIAGMAGSLAGGTSGVSAIPENLRLAVDRANRRSWHDLARRFVDLSRFILERDRGRLEEREQALSL